jgi:lysyl-tRNA synthetase class 2
LIAQRRAKLVQLRAAGQAYRNDFRRDALAADLHVRFADSSAEELEREPVRVAVAGRMMTQRVMGKASFAHLQDMSGEIQLFVKRDGLPEGVYNRLQKLGSRRHPRAEGVHVPYRKRRAVDPGRSTTAADQSVAAVAGKMAWF